MRNNIVSRAQAASALCDPPTYGDLIPEGCLDAWGVDAESVRSALSGRRAGTLSREDVRQLSHSTSFISNHAFAYYLGDMVSHLDCYTDEEDSEETTFISMAIRRRFRSEEFLKQFPFLAELEPDLLSWLQRICPE